MNHWGPRLSAPDATRMFYFLWFPWKMNDSRVTILWLWPIDPILHNELNGYTLGSDVIMLSFDQPWREGEKGGKYPGPGLPGGPDIFKRNFGFERMLIIFSHLTKEQNELEGEGGRGVEIPSNQALFFSLWGCIWSRIPVNSNRFQYELWTVIAEIGQLSFSYIFEVARCEGLAFLFSKIRYLKVLNIRFCSIN